MAVIVTSATFVRELVEAFLETCGNTNIEIIARGSTLTGADTRHIIKETYYKGFQHPFDPQQRIREKHSGPGFADPQSAMMRLYSVALSQAQGDDLVGAIETLVTYLGSTGFFQIELHPLRWIQQYHEGEDALPHDKPNPLADGTHIIWRLPKN